MVTIFLPDSNKIESERYKAPAVRFKEVEPRLSRTAGALWMAASFLSNGGECFVSFKRWRACVVWCQKENLVPMVRRSSPSKG